MTVNVAFQGEPDRREVDDDSDELVFRAEHAEGGISEVSVLVPKKHASETWAIDRARALANEAFAKAGGGGAGSLNISLGW